MRSRMCSESTEHAPHTICSYGFLLYSSSGNFAVVKKAVKLASGRPYAIKIIDKVSEFLFFFSRSNCKPTEKNPAATGSQAGV